MPNYQRIFFEPLALPAAAQRYEISRRVSDQLTDRYVLQTEEHSFDVDEFAKAGKCGVWVLDDIPNVVDAHWEIAAASVSLQARHALLEVLWNGHRLQILQMELQPECFIDRQYVIAESESIAVGFFAAVCAWNTEIKDEVLVFRNAIWQKDKKLHQEIAAASLDNLVLAGSLREELLQNFEGFFESEATYARYGVAWKRGILMLGPPGNGKTHAIKGLIARCGKPCLYVRTIQSVRVTPQECVERVFARARALAPCVLVLEDLDSLIDRKSLSVFLNEMDGFAANHGVLTVATTNHPEKLDVALLERPSRFDRKVTFGLPTAETRRQYLTLLTSAFEPSLRLSPAEIARIVRLTSGFSYAYLKELCLTSMMAWMRNATPGSMARIMTQQVAMLRSQMKTTATAPPPKKEEDDD